jgi:hypothetical protein
VRGEGFSSPTYSPSGRARRGLARRLAHHRDEPEGVVRGGGCGGGEPVARRLAHHRGEPEGVVEGRGEGWGGFGGGWGRAQKAAR